MPEDNPEDLCGPGYLVLHGGWWFTRGIEGSVAKRRDVRFTRGVRLEVSWNLPASNRDPKALGEERTHGCLCSESEWARLCPFHKTWKWLTQLKRLFPAPKECNVEGQEKLDNIPLFPNRRGHHASKEATIRAIKLVMSQLGENLSKTDGKGKVCERFSEHVQTMHI